jgi:hypothetical protein
VFPLPAWRLLSGTLPSRSVSRFGGKGDVSDSLLVDSLTRKNPNIRSCYDPRDEARKSWDYCVSKEAVYIGNFLSGHRKVGIPFPELYNHGRAWIEVELPLVLKGNTYFHCIFIVEVLDQNSGIIGDENVQSSGVNGDDAMLVEIAKHMQIPEGMVLRRTTSLVRLNCVNLSGDFIGKQLEPALITPKPVGLRDIGDDREVNIPFGVLPRSGERELPSKLIESGTETIQELSQEHSNNDVHRLHLRPADISRILRILLCDDGVRVFKVNVEFPIESIKMRLCPFGFLYQIGQGGE